MHEQIVTLVPNRGAYVARPTAEEVLIRLSGEFHILLAQMTRNRTLERIMRELTSLTCLIITLYDRPGAPACPQDEHTQLVQMIEKGDSAVASQHMLQHLVHIERTLNLDGDLNYSPDFEAIFAD